MDINDFVNVATSTNNTIMKAYTLVNGEERKLADTVKPVLSFRSFSKLQLKGINSTLKAEITYDQAAKFFEYLRDGSYAPTMYRNVKNNEHWKTAYGVQNYNFATKTKAGVSSSETLNGAACRKCNLILPLKILTVDHQRPQEGGSNLAILRFFRALGLTEGGPSIGGKNRAALARYAANVGGDSTIGAAASKDAKKYQLSSVGIIYYTVLWHGKFIGKLQEVCMHHYLNLRPLCGPCNSSLSNSNIW